MKKQDESKWFRRMQNRNVHQDIAQAAIKLARRSLRSLQYRQRDGILMDPCPLCGQPTHSWIYCRKYKRDICQDHCEDCPWFMGKMLWSCRYSERKKTHENRYLQPKRGRR